MIQHSHSLNAFAWFVALAALGATGCLCPPCPGKVAAGPGSAGANAAGVGAPVAKGSKLMLWDGDEAGGGAQPWESCDQKPDCKAKVNVESGVGVGGSNAIKFHGEGGGWIGMGWNLFGWYPENAGVDLGPYSHLTFQIRVEGPTPGTPVDPGAAAVLLGCSGNKFDSADAPIEKFVKTYADGKWHKVQIPISTLTRGAGAKFDPHSFWEFRISTWSGNKRNFDIYIDEIAAEKL
jgi:hypothetical protein